MRFSALNHLGISVSMVLVLLLSGGSGLGSGGGRGKKRFCNCAFDCLTAEGVEHHNVTLSGEW